MKKNYDIEIDNALHESGEKQLLEYFRQDMDMSDSAWYFFCKRYYERNVTTVADYIREMYGKEISHQKLQKAMYEALENMLTEVIL